MVQSRIGHTRRLEDFGLRVLDIAGDGDHIPNLVIEEQREVGVLINVAVDHCKENPAKPEVQVLIGVFAKMAGSVRVEAYTGSNSRFHDLKVNNVNGS